MPTSSVPAADRAARRAGWVLLGCAGMAACTALFNPSSYSQSTAYNDDGRLRLEYSRLDRAGSPTRLRLWVAPGQASDGRLRIRMNMAYTKVMRITRIHPEPERVETGLEDIVFVFREKERRGPSLLEFDVMPIDLGRYDGRLAVVGDRSVEFTQYMMP